METMHGYGIRSQTMQRAWATVCYSDLPTDSRTPEATLHVRFSVGTRAWPIHGYYDP